MHYREAFVVDLVQAQAADANGEPALAVLEQTGAPGRSLQPKNSTRRCQKRTDGRKGERGNGAREISARQIASEGAEAKATKRRKPQLKQASDGRERMQPASALTAARR
mgnify:CR=1 FL=1